jgi:Domain of unknown function (DUF1963)
MNRILSGLGCFGLILLAILFALAVTEAIKHVGPLERMLVLIAALLTAAAVAFLLDRLKNGPLPALPKSEPEDEPKQQERIALLADRPKDQTPKVDVGAILLQMVSEVTKPAPTLPIHDTILAARRQAILFRQIVPPKFDPTHLSFFGGLPIAPSGFQWPSGESRPFSFIMQLNCSAVPANGRLGMFPDNGVLYLFLDLSWNQKDLFRVIWEPGPAQGWAEIAPPDDLPHAYQHKGYWSWPQADADWPRLLPKWPFDPVLIQGGPLPDDQEAFDETYSWPGTINTRETIPAIEGAIVQHLSFWMEGGKPRKDRRPFAGFPHDWNAIRITTGLIAEGMNHTVFVARKRYFRELSDEEYNAKVVEAQTELREWSDRASVAAAFDEVPPAVGDQFWSWVMEREWLTRMPMIDAGNLSVEASLTAGPDAAARIPLDVIDYIRSRHALGTVSETGLHIDIPDRMLAPPVDVQGTIDERVREFVLLLELSANEGIAHYFAEGVLQFWIRPEDLAARRFDRVEFSATAY